MIQAGATDQTNNLSGQRREVDQIIRHDDWNGLVQDGFDIALLHLSTPLWFCDKVSPIIYASPLNTNLADIASGVDALITGWGVDSDGELHDILEKIVVPIMSDDDANTENGTNFVDNTQIAFDGGGTLAHSAGDSGGPAVVGINGVNVLIGITSWGYNPPEEFPSIDADVRALSGFIDDNITIPVCQGYCITVAEEEIWNEDNIYDAYKEIHVYGKLTINYAVINMTEGAKIYVHSGGELILNNTTITGCNGSIWYGIELEKRHVGFDPNDPEETRAVVEIHNLSIIENAEYGISCDRDGKIIIDGNSTLINNAFALDCDVFQYGYGPFAGYDLEVDIDYCNFENNFIAFLSGRSNNINISHSFFKNNHGGVISWDGMNYDGDNKIESCVFINNYTDIVLGNMDKTNIENNTFRSADKRAIWLKGGSGDINVFGNTFSNQTIGIESAGAIYTVDNYNQFFSCDIGIYGEAEYGDKTSMNVENNYFSGCGKAIELNGINLDDGAVIKDNGFEYNDEGIILNNSNRFEIQDNQFIGTSDNIFMEATGDDGHPNTVYCNEIMEPDRGINFKNDNSATNFIGNVFSQTTDYDVYIENATLVDNIGDYKEPALNYFSDDGNDITIDGANPWVKYWIPPADNPIPNTDPVNVPLELKRNSSTGVNTKCVIPEPPEVVDYPTVITTLLDYCRLLEEYNNDPNNPKLKAQFEAAERKTKRYLYYVYKYKWSNIEDILKQGCDYYFKKKLFYFYMNSKDCYKADSVLNEIEFLLTEDNRNTSRDSLEREKIQSFVATQRIGHRYHCDSTIAVIDISLTFSDFEFTSDEITSLYREALKSIPEAAYARSLYHIATGNIVPHYWSEFSIFPNEKLNAKMGSGNNNLSIYPNPSYDRLFISFNDKYVFSGKVYIYNIYGNKVLYKNIDTQYNNRLEIDVSNFVPGLYFLSIKDINEGNIKTSKIIIE